MKLVVVAASSLLAVASPAFAHPSDTAATPNGAREATESPATPATGENADSERMVCRRVEDDTSSRMGSRKICMTAEQWRRQQRPVAR
jgi:hypothetical protein